MSIKDPSDIPVAYPYLLEDLSVGDRILLADGQVLLRAESKTSDKVTCEVLSGGMIHSHKGVNLPSSTLRIPSFTEKDQKDLAYGLEQGVDFVALSFVRHEKDLEPVREIIEKAETKPLLLAKIEKPQAIERLEEILARVDGVMVARGDLGVEMPLEEVPMIQKKIIRMARQAGKPVITATQMLRSMIDNPRPTRAEATDVANAILDGTDALMLSDETAIGAYPIAAVRVLDRIARATERHLHDRSFSIEPLSETLPMTASAIGRSACFLAEDLRADAIVACTSSGSTARLVARFRPACPVLGLTPSEQTERQLTLSWGVEPALVAPFTSTDEIFDLAREWALEHQAMATGGRIVVTAGVPVGEPGTTNLLKVIMAE
jgi:pyruvate kinase